MNQPYATLTLASALREMFGVQLYKNNARVLLSRILSILNLDWLQHARSVRGVYEWLIQEQINRRCCCNKTPPMTRRNLDFFTRTFMKSAKLFTRKLCQTYAV